MKMIFMDSENQSGSGFCELNVESCCHSGRKRMDEYCLFFLL
jgi:hypothetical protein